MNPRSRVVAGPFIAWPAALVAFVLPLLFATSVGVVNVFVPLPAVALVALLLVAIAASVSIGGRASGITAVIASAIGAAAHTTTLELLTLIGAGVGIVMIVVPLRDAIARSDEVRRASADAREWLRQIVDRLADPVVVWDRQGRVAFVNERAFALLGAPPVHAVDVGRVLRGEEVAAREIRVTDTERRERVLVVTASPLRSGTAIIGAVATFSDVTDLKSLEQERSDFYVMLGHEIKTPLTAVSGQAQLLRRLIERGGTEEQMRRSALELDNAIARLRELTTEVGDLATMRAGRFTLRPREVDLRDIVRSAMARNAARSDRHTITTALPEAPAPVMCDEFRVEQVLDNLIANAIQYSPGGGQIRLVLVLQGENAVVQIIDQGMGVPAFERGRIFEPFYRASNARSRRGTGLGLAISRDILRRSGGDVWLERTGSEGSTFALVLPIVRRT